MPSASNCSSKPMGKSTNLALETSPSDGRGQLVPSTTEKLLNKPLHDRRGQLVPITTEKLLNKPLYENYVQPLLPHHAPTRKDAMRSEPVNEPPTQFSILNQLSPGNAVSGQGRLGEMGWEEIREPPSVQ